MVTMPKRNRLKRGSRMQRKRLPVDIKGMSTDELMEYYNILYETIAERSSIKKVNALLEADRELTLRETG